MAMKDLVKRIFSDEATKTRFASDPDSLMSEFSLSENEKKAVTTTFAHLGTGSSGSANMASTVGTMDEWV
jgi:hypothetical protein